MNKSLKYILGLFILVFAFTYVENFLFKKQLDFEIVLEDNIEMANSNSNSSNSLSLEKESNYHVNAFTNQLLKASLLVLKKSKTDLYDQTGIYIEIAEAYHQLGQTQNANSVINYVLKLNQQTRRNLYLYSNLDEIAEYCLKHGNHKQAKELLEQAFILVKKISDYEERDIMLTRIGEKFGIVGEFERAIESADLIEDDLDKLFLYQYLAKNYIDDQQYQQVDLIIKKVGTTGLENLLFEELVKIHLSHEDFKRAFEIIKMIDQEQAKVNALSDIAQKYWELGNKSQAVANLTEAKTIVDQIEDSTTKSWSLKSISRVYQQMDLPLKSEPLLAKSLKESQLIDDKFLQGFAFNNLAFQLASAGKYDEAIATIESANPTIPIFQKVRLLIAISEQYLKSDQPEKAEQIVAQAMKTVNEITGKELSIPREDAQSFAWNDIGDYALENKQYDLAFKILEQMDSDNGKIHLLLKISNAYIDEGKPDKGKKTLLQARKILSKNPLGSGLSEPMMIADSYAKMGDYFSAIAAVKLIPKDIYQAQTLKEIALKHARSPQEIDQATWQALQSLM